MRRLGWILGFMIFMLTPLVSAEQGRYAIITKVDGQVEVRLFADSAPGAWQAAKAGMTLHEKDEIRTGPKSIANLLIDESGKTGQFELKPDSRLRVNTLALDAASGDKTTLLDLAIGDVLVHAEKLKGNSKFEVRTPNSTTGVRGTTFLVSANPKKAKN